MKVPVLMSLLALCMSAALQSHAGVTSAASGLVTTLRVESTIALITLPTALGSDCGARVWVDLSTGHGKAAYSTAMLAYAMGKPVSVRADDAGQRLFGACRLYDIWM